MGVAYTVSRIQVHGGHVYHILQVEFIRTVCVCVCVWRERERKRERDVTIIGMLKSYNSHAVAIVSEVLLITFLTSTIHPRYP